MINTTFYIKGEDRLKETLKFINDNMPSATFLSKPIKLFNNKWEVSIRYNNSETYKLISHINKYYQMDNPVQFKRKWFNSLRSR